MEGWVLVLESSWFNVGVVRLLGEDHSLRDLHEEALELRDLGLVPLDLGTRRHEALVALDAPRRDDPAGRRAVRWPAAPAERAGRAPS